jgi:hypothetical protein
MLSLPSFISLLLRYRPLPAIVEQANTDGKPSPADAAHTTIIACALHCALLHLQHICSKISLSDCKSVLTERWTDRPIFEQQNDVRGRVPVCLLAKKKLVA